MNHGGLGHTSADELYFNALKATLFHGARESPRGYATRDVLSWSATLMNPRARLVRNPVRDLRIGYAAANVAWNLGERDTQDILWWNPNGRHILDEGSDTFYGANYGQRWIAGVTECLELLRLDRQTRRAWFPIWHPDDLCTERRVGGNLVGLDPRHYSRKGRDVPCMLGAQMRIIDDDLHFQVVMRSQSVGVLPYDLFLLSSLQELCANTLGVGLGELHWHCNSLHVYEREYKQRQDEHDWYADYHVQHALVHDIEYPMEPITLTLEDAKIQWPFAMDMIAEGKEPFESDPMVWLMFEGRPREGAKA